MEDKSSNESPKATDIEISIFFATHIEKPCEVEIGEGVKENIRQFYIQEAQKTLETLKDPDAKAFLKETIEKYTK